MATQELIIGNSCLITGARTPFANKIASQRRRSRVPDADERFGETRQTQSSLELAGGRSEKGLT